MKSFESTATIQATPEAVWQVLVDAPAFATWDSGVERVEGRVALGETIKVFSKVSPGRAFPVKVVELAPSRRMVWSGGMPLGLFKGVRSYTLTPLADGATEFRMREEYLGPLAGMMTKSIPDLQPSFDRFASGLKQWVERGG
jgi:hypothetical protein